MVAIAIIALLTGIITVNLTKSRAKGRDAKRISDIGLLQLALELYFDRCNKYPMPTPLTISSNTSFTIDPTSSCTTSNGTTVTIKTFIATIPVPPTGGGETAYQYWVPNDGSSFFANPTDYSLGTNLEGYNEILKDDVDVTDGNFYDSGPNCTDNTSNVFHYCVGPQ